MNQIYNDDMFNVMPLLADNCIDLIICDLPYGTTVCAWDNPINIEDFWEQVWRVTKKDAPVVCFASQPFTSILLMSQRKHFKYEWIWEKSKCSNFMAAKKLPLKSHESLLVFCRGKTPYYPQMQKGEPFKARPGKKITEVYRPSKDPNFRNDNSGLRYPRSILYFKTAETEGETIHPTQKPVDLVRYMIRTYTKENDLVLDPCIGSGTTAIACLREKRNFLGIESNATYYDACLTRISNETGSNSSS
jgi:site-specific DNA-methyltransferase (adenine-specific)